MGFAQRIWSKDISSESKMYPDSVYMYDAGNFVGMLTLKGDTKRWSGYTVVSRVKTSETIEEFLEPAHEFTVPMRFFSVEHYPAKIEGSILWIPGWKIHWRSRATEEQLDSQLPQPSLPSSLPPSKQQLNQGQPLPSPQSSQSYRTPSSQPLPKSPSGKQEQSRHSSQNKSSSESKQKASLSSNQAFHGRLKQSTPGKSGEHPSQSSPILPSPISQYLPPSTPEGSNPQPTSSSRTPSSLKRHLPSQPARRQHGGKSQHPTFSQPSSHE